MPSNDFPKLRPLDVRPIVHNGHPCVLLRDPLQLTDGALTISRLLAPILLLCDGTRDHADLRLHSVLRYGLSVSGDTIDALIDALDTALLLENERFLAARTLALEAYRRAPFRPPLLAGQAYPAEPHELAALLDSYLRDVEHITPHIDAVRGLLSPHIDYARGGATYAAVWKRAGDAVRAADLVVLLGTDHYGDAGRLTLTRQQYATPWGLLPTPQPLVDELERALGPGLLEHELRHRGEHSIELVATWLHFMRGGAPVEMLPILVGSFADFVRGDAHPAEDAELSALLEVLERQTARRRVLIVASGDMAHVGPAFGGRALDRAGQAAIQRADDELLGFLRAGDAAGFFAAIQRVGDRNNICSLPPLYLALRLLGGAQGEQVAYAQCPADERDTSLVSVAGVVFM